MNDILYLLLRASISASLSERETFINHLSNIIENNTGKDPETARRISDHITGLMEGLNGQLLVQQLLRPRRDKKLTQTLDELTNAIEKLNSLLEQNDDLNNPTNTNAK